MVRTSCPCGYGVGSKKESVPSKICLEGIASTVTEMTSVSCDNTRELVWEIVKKNSILVKVFDRKGLLVCGIQIYYLFSIECENSTQPAQFSENSIIISWGKIESKQFITQLLVPLSLWLFFF